MHAGMGRSLYGSVEDRSVSQVKENRMEKCEICATGLVWIVKGRRFKAERQIRESEFKGWKDTFW